MDASECEEASGTDVDTVAGDNGDHAIGAINGFRIFVAAIGLLGNVTVILTILLVGNLRKRVTSWYVLQLAIADTAFLVTLPFQIVEDQRNAWILPDWMCKAKNTVMYVNYYSSITLLTIMALDRYVAIVHGFSEILRKFRTRRGVCIISATTWVICIVISIPVMLYTEVKGFKPNCKCVTEFVPTTPKLDTTEIDNRCAAEGLGDNSEIFFEGKTKLQYCRFLLAKIEETEGFCLKPLDQTCKPTVETNGTVLHRGCHYLDASQGFKGFIFFNFIVMFLVPFIVITMSYTSIVQYMKKTTARMKSFKDQSNTANKNKKHQKVVIMCVTLVVVFVICWLPFHIIHLAKLVGIQGSSTMCKNLQYAMMLLTYLNSAINPFVYFIAARFRSQFRRFREAVGSTTVMSMVTQRRSSENSRATTDTSKDKSTREVKEERNDKSTAL